MLRDKRFSLVDITGVFISESFNPYLISFSNGLLSNIKESCKVMLGLISLYAMFIWNVVIGDDRKYLYRLIFLLSKVKSSDTFSDIFIPLQNSDHKRSSTFMNM
jgi:hypothetical protein